MRVLHFYKTYFPDTVGGVQRVINQLARATKPYGIETTVLSLSNQKHPLPITLDGHQIHRVYQNFEIASTGFSFGAFKRFKQLANEADVIHYHYPWPFMDIVHFASRINIPTVLTYHSDIVRQRTLLTFYNPLKNRFLASVNQIVATSPNYLETSTELTTFRDKTMVIPIGIDKSFYPTPSDQLLATWRSRLPARYFLFIGVLRYYKGLHILLKAVQGLNYPIVIAGAGPIEEELKKQANRLGLTNIHFLGALAEEDKVAILKNCFAVTFPSHLRSEAFGISLLEGAMFGKPLISSEIGTGTSFINIHDETGLVVPAGDANAFKEAMRFLWENPSIALRMGQQAEQRYWQLFTAQHMAARYVEVYQRLAGA